MGKYEHCIVEPPHGIVSKKLILKRCVHKCATISIDSYDNFYVKHTPSPKKRRFFEFCIGFDLRS